jgi:hypothetical protein
LRGTLCFPSPQAKYKKIRVKRESPAGDASRSTDAIANRIGSRHGSQVAVTVARNGQHQKTFPRERSVCNYAGKITDDYEKNFRFPL